MFHSWKRSFKAMMRDADIAQDLNYLRSSTSSNPLELVENFRKRQGDSPATTLRNLWAEFGRHFGNPVALTQALLKRLCTAANFSDKDNTKLQELEDLCADVHCLMTQRWPTVESQQRRLQCLLKRNIAYCITCLVRERGEWISQERLCYRCFSPNHIASACKESIKCSICGSEQHPDLLHLSREDKKGSAPKEREPSLCVEIPENVKPKWTLMQQDSTG